MRFPILVVIAAVSCVSLPAQAQQGADMFRGQQISLLIGAGVGGGADVYARLLARHYGSFLPGHPTVVARNSPGAGGLKLANQIYNISPKDGTEIGTFLTSTALEPLFGNKEAKYETTKFTWIGNMLDSDVTACISWRGMGIKTWEDLKDRETTYGASGPSSLTSVQAKVVGTLLGLKTKIIYGYQGTQTSNLAMQRGELDATCGLYMSTIVSQFAGQVASGDMVVWMTFGQQRAKEFPNVPTIFELVKNSDDRQLAELMFGQQAIGRPITAPPGLSAERTAALRNSFMATMADKGFLDSAKRAGLSISPLSGEATQKQYEVFYNFPNPVVERAMALMGRHKSE